MKISAFNLASYMISNNNRNNTNFDGYSEVISKSMRDPVKNLGNAQDVFESLIKEIDKDKSVSKSNFFKTINNIFKQNGLKGLFKELTQTSDNKYINEVMKIVKNENILPLAKDKKEIFDIVSYSGGKNDIHLGFTAVKENGGMEFYLDKKGDLFVEQTFDNDFLCTGFYSDTGTKKVEIVSYAGGKPDKTFYNKDGSKPFFKNWFLGGPAVEAIY